MTSEGMSRARASRLKRPWCWLTGHDWAITIYESDVATVHYAKCVRCGEEREMLDRISIGKDFPRGELYD